MNTSVKIDIPDYHWTEEADTRLADLVKEHPMMYDKKQKEGLNLATKSSQWDRVGEQMEPPATGVQCKKHYENMRARLGKVLKKEKKSGDGQPQRTIRDDELLHHLLEQVRCNSEIVSVATLIFPVKFS